MGKKLIIDLDGINNMSLSMRDLLDVLCGLSTGKACDKCPVGKAKEDTCVRMDIDLMSDSFYDDWIKALDKYPFCQVVDKNAVRIDQPITGGYAGEPYICELLKVHPYQKFRVCESNGGNYVGDESIFQINEFGWMQEKPEDNCHDWQVNITGAEALIKILNGTAYRRLYTPPKVFDAIRLLFPWAETLYMGVCGEIALKNKDKSRIEHPKIEGVNLDPGIEVYLKKGR